MKLNKNKCNAAKAHFTLKKCALLVLLFTFSSSVWAQFSVSATTTPQTCNGNGIITLSVQNQDPGATINYIVYLGTDTSGTVVSNGAISTIVSQSAGNYYIVATQSVGNTVTSATTTAVIENQIVPIDFTLEKTPVNCGDDATITANVISGVAVSYRLISTTTGLITGPQASNVFTGLAAGQYKVDAISSCNDSYPGFITVLSEYHELAFNDASFPDVELLGCDLLTIKNTISSVNGVAIIYPLQVKFTVYPPTGGSVEYNVTVETGEQFLASASQVIPYYYAQSDHTYKIAVTDICGKTIESPIYIINPLLIITGETKNVGCLGKSIEYKPFKYVGPFTLEFTQAPPGFNPTDYNDQYPGPYVTADVPVIFGETGNPLPPGNYQVKIYDACNRAVDPVSSVIEIEPIDLDDVEVVANPSNATCATGGAVEAYITGLFVGKAVIDSYTGPGTYTSPVDVSNFIKPNKQSVIVGALPVGEYSITLTDTCGHEFPPEIFEIKPYAGDKATANSRPDCEVGYGTVQFSGSFTHIEITAAPAGFPYPLPYDVTAYYNDNINAFSMDHLPPGQYKFSGSNDCDDDVEINAPTRVVPVFAYSESVNEYDFVPHCGSFDLFFNHQSTGVAFIKFALQKLDEDTGKWTHPGTGIIYNEGDAIVVDPNELPENRNGLQIKNNFNNIDLDYPSGKYRIVKQYTTYNDGSLKADTYTKYCTTTLYEFEYYKDLIIEGAVNLACMGNSGEFQIIAHGVPPLNYKIVTKNGNPFIVDNGTNNTFSGLESAVYLVEVNDACTQKTYTFNIAEIPPLVYLPDPADLDPLSACDEGEDGTENFNISVYTPILLGTQDPDDVTISYYKSQADAQLGINTIPDPTSVITGTTTIYVRASHSANIDCVVTTHFDLIVKPLPALIMKDTWGGCDGNDITIIADPGYAYYAWTDPSGQVSVIHSNEITVTDPGAYSVSVKDNFGCENTKDFEVVLSPLPVIRNVEVDDWTDTSNVITVVMEQTDLPGNYEYSLDNITFQDSPVFIGLAPGQYTVYVKDKFDCGADTFPTYILTYPKFFTPNNDGINEYWKIKFSILEPDMLVYIYDRYGKLITGFGADSKGWDGTFNGAKLPSTDYWFVVKRQNGEELKGHFSMIR